jgi:hypothetical protein
MTSTPLAACVDTKLSTAISANASAAAEGAPSHSALAAAEGVADPADAPFRAAHYHNPSQLLAENSAMHPVMMSSPCKSGVTWTNLV